MSDIIMKGDIVVLKAGTTHPRVSAPRFRGFMVVDEGQDSPSVGGSKTYPSQFVKLTSGFSYSVDDLRTVRGFKKTYDDGEI